MTLTNEQLRELTALINARLAEFHPMALPTLSPGIVRLVYGVLQEWQWEQETPAIPTTDLPWSQPVKEAEEVEAMPQCNGKLPDPDAAREAIATMLAGGGNGHVAFAPKVHEVTGKRHSAWPTLAEIIDHLRTLAMAGVMPRHVTYDAERPAGWPCAQAIMREYAVTWTELAEKAGLKMERPRARKGEA